MKFLVISCGNADYDGRLRELLKVCNDLGDVSCYSYGSKELFRGHHLYGSGVSYGQFIRNVLRDAGKEEADAIFVDNRRATIPAMLLNRKKKAKLILDCRELYDASQFKELFNKIGCMAERRCAKKADILICANSFRADYMEKHWGTRRPIVFENVRKLEYDEDAMDKAAELIDPYLGEDEIRIVSTYGCSVDRTNDVLVRNINKIDGNVKVFLVGSSGKEDEDTIRRIVKEQKAEDKVVILRQMNQTELKYLISRSHIGVVNYNQKDLNNKYCASGKIYEFVYEGIPVITTENPPLKKFCSDFGVGESDDEYYNGINKLIANYDQYKDKVNAYVSTHEVDDNNRILSEKLREELKING